MASVRLDRLVLRSAARAEIMNSEGVMAAVEDLTAQAQATAESFGSASYDHDTQPGRVRCHGIVWTPSLHAIRSNAKHNSLLKALGSMGG